MLKKKIEKLIDLIENTEIEEIEISSFWGAQKIRLSKSKKSPNTVVSKLKNDNQNNPVDLEQESPQISNINEPNVIESSIELNNNGQNVTENDNYEDETKFKSIKAPLVGTFYSSPKPGDPSFINIGDMIETGKIVCIIEAMKIFNEIENDSGVNGKLVHVYVEDGTPVEYGQELFVLKISNV